MSMYITVTDAELELKRASISRNGRELMPAPRFVGKLKRALI